MTEKSQYKSFSEWRKANPKDYGVAYDRGWLKEICEIFGWKPKGYWNYNKNLCLIEAKKYKSRTEWKNNSPTSYRTALRNNWLDDATNHMELNIIPTNYWTLELCLTEAKKYMTKNMWKRNSSSTFRAATTKGWLDMCTAHMIKQKQKPKKYWVNKKRCISEARKYKSKSEWCSNSPTSHRNAIKYGWFDECISHMSSTRKPNGYWKIKENVLKESRKYKTRTEWAKKCNSSRHAAIKYGWFDECIEHMEKQFIWTKELCYEEAKKYNRIVDWKKVSNASYTKARVNGWLDECKKRLKNG